VFDSETRKSKSTFQMFTKIRHAALIFGFLLVLLRGVASAQQSHAWTSRDKIAFTYYFYWYNVHDPKPTGHFINPEGTDALTDHPPADSLANYSYTDVSWHQQQMQDMVAAGIDVALPVYWGDTQDLFWSQTGLRTMVTALQAMAQARAPFPGIGMFFDTTSLWKQNALKLPDITTLDGKATFYGMVHDFFSIVPKSLWATIDGRPIVVLYYSSWVAAYDQSSLDYLSQRFQSDFGVSPYFIRERSWRGVVADAACAWGAALSGPIVVGDTASVGPGYDDRAVPNRNPYRYKDRECSGFYQQAWDKIISSTPRLVFVETWNELHEATEVAATREYGRQYIDLTARNVARWKSYTGYASASMVWLSPGRDSFESGLRIALNQGDGGWQVNRVAGRDAVDVDRTTTPASHYIYLDVNDGFVHSVTTPVWVTVEYLDTGRTPWRIQYDSASNPYTVLPFVPIGDTGLWKRVTFSLPDAYFGGRENGGSDLRIDDPSTTSETHYFSRVWITKSAPNASILQLVPLADVVLDPGSTTDLPLTVSSSDGSLASLTLARAPAFASLQSRNGAPVLHLAPSISDAQACSFLITVVVNGATASLADATSLRVLVPNTGSGVTCDYTLNSIGQAFAAQGGAGTITITTGAGCPWMVGTPPAGVAFTGATSGTGIGAVTFRVFANGGGNRSGSFTIAGQTFTVEQQAVSSGGVWILPSSARAPGAAGAFYTTDLTLANTGEREAQVTLKFLGNNVDGRTGPGKSIRLPTHNSTTFRDILGTLFGFDANYGAIQINSDVSSLVILSHTSTPGGAGTFGQSVPVPRDVDFVRRGINRAIAGIREDESFRTNLILANAVELPVTVDITLLGESGSVLAVSHVNLLPSGMTQLTNVVRALGVEAGVQGAQLILTTATEGGAFVTYASLIDNGTNDPRTLLPQAPSAAVSWVLPSSARAPGASGAFYTTDLIVANSSDSEVPFTVKFLGNNIDGRSGPEKDFLLEPRKSVTYSDVLGSTFGLESGFGAVRVTARRSGLTVLGLTATPATLGTFGQSVPAFTTSDLIQSGVPKSIVGLREDSAFRINLILANASESDCVVDVALIGDNGQVLGQQSYPLLPLAMTQVTRVVEKLAPGVAVSSARLLLSTKTAGGAFAAYAAVIDNGTNDPRTLLPQ